MTPIDEQQIKTHAEEYVTVIDDISGNGLIDRDDQLSYDALNRIVTQALKYTSDAFRYRLAQISSKRLNEDTPSILGDLERFLSRQAGLDPTYSHAFQAASTMKQRIERDLNEQIEGDLSFFEELDGALEGIDAVGIQEGEADSIVSTDALILSKLVQRMEEPARSAYRDTLIAYAKKVQESEDPEIGAKEFFDRLGLDSDGNPVEESQES